MTLESVVGGGDGVFIVGGSGMALRWDGTALVRENTSCSQSLLGIARAGSDVVSVGEGYCMTRRSGGSWSALLPMPTPSTDKSGYYSVVASTGSSIWVSGRPGNLYRLDGTNWSQLELKTMEVASGLLGLPSGEVWIGGSDLYRVASSLPTRINARPQEVIYSLSGATADTVWGVGFQGTVLRRNGTTWEPVRSEATSSLYGVYSPSAEAALVIGFDATGSTLSRCTKTACGLVEKPVIGVEYTSIHGVDADTFWIVGKGGLLKAWTKKSGALTDDTNDIPKGAELNHVFALDATRAYAVGEQGLVIVRRDTGWTTDNSVQAGRQSLQAVWASSASDVWIGGSNGFVARFNGASWSAIASGVSETISGISGTGPSDVWAVTLSGTVLHYDGQAFSVVSQFELPRLQAVEGRSGHVYVAGALGSILHKSPSP